MSYTPNNPNGQTTKANSAPVTLASDQNNALETGGNLATIVTNTTSLATSANLTSGTQQTKITDATNIANILKSDGTSAGTNAQIVASQQNATTTATWTSSTTVNTTLAQSTNGQGTAVVTSIETGTTTTTGALTFEAYDGTNWWAITGQQVGSYTVQSSYTLANNTNIAWSFDVGGFQQFRVRLSTAIAGTGSPQVVLIVQIQASANNVTPTVGVAQQLDQTNDSISAWEKGWTYTKISASGSVVSGTCLFGGYIVEATSSGTLIVYDNTAASGNTIGGSTAITLGAAGTVVTYMKPIIMTTGLYATIGGTSATINFLTRSISK